MARNTEEVIIQLEGRDKGKRFIITEMFARQAERWADRALLALSQSAVSLPPNMVSRGMQGIADILSIVGNLQFPELENLTDELLHTCVKICPDPERPHFTRDLIDSNIQGDDIEEVATRQFLRQVAVRVHTNFFFFGNILSLISTACEMRDIATISPDTPASRKRSRPLSRRASRRSTS